jgi:hypothetical protein
LSALVSGHDQQLQFVSPKVLTSKSDTKSLFGDESSRDPAPKPVPGTVGSIFDDNSHSNELLQNLGSSMDSEPSIFGKKKDLRQSKPSGLFGDEEHDAPAETRPVAQTSTPSIFADNDQSHTSSLLKDLDTSSSQFSSVLTTKRELRQSKPSALFGGEEEPEPAPVQETPKEEAPPEHAFDIAKANSLSFPEIDSVSHQGNLREVLWESKHTVSKY